MHRLSLIVPALALTFVAPACDDPADEAELQALDMENGPEDLAQANGISEVDARDRIVNDAPAPALSCSGSGCNGKDPVDYGCADDAQTVEGSTKKIVGWPYTLYLDQRWSPNCGTRWTRTYSGSQAYYETTVTIQRDTDDYEKYPYNHSGTLNYTDMVYCPRSICAANSYAEYDDNEYQTGYFY